jgi:hypothetical protein
VAGGYFSPKLFFVVVNPFFVGESLQWKNENWEKGGVTVCHAQPDHA